MKFSYTIAIIALFVCIIAPTGYAQSTTNSQSQFNRNTMIQIKLRKAQECIDKGDYIGAKINLNGVLNLDKNNVKAKQLLVVCNNGIKSVQPVSTTLSLSKTSLSFTALGGNDKINIISSSNSYSVELLPSWCTVQKYSNYIVITCNSNPSISTRNDYFEVRAADKLVRVYINQVGKASTSGAVLTSLSLSNSSLSFTALGGNKNINITTNSNSYTVELLPSWCTVKKYSDYFVITSNSNPSSSSRSDYFEVKAGDKSVRVNINQAGKVETTTNTTLSVSKDYLYFESRGGKSESITVSSNVANYSISEIPGWCSVETYTGYFTVTCNANYNKEKRIDWLYVNAGEKQVKVYINQNGTTSINTYGKYKKTKPTKLYLGIGVLKPMVFKADGTTLANNDVGYNLMIGLVKTIGVYSKISTNFSTTFGDYKTTDLPNTFYINSIAESSPTFTRLGVVGGLMIDLKPTIMYFGAGKGFYYHLNKADLYNYWDNSYNRTINLTTISESGFETDAGLIMKFNKLGLSLGVSSINFRYLEFNFGLGISL